MIDWTNILAARDDDRGSGKWILPLVIFGFIILGKIIEWIKKRQEEAKQRQQQYQSPPPTSPPEEEEKVDEFEVDVEEEPEPPPVPPTHRYRPIPEPPPPMPRPEAAAPSPIPLRRPAPSAAPISQTTPAHRSVEDMEDIAKVDDEVELKRRLLEEKLHQRADRLVTAAPREADTAAIEAKLLHVRPGQAAAMARIAGVSVDLHDPRIALRGMLYHEIFSLPKALRNSPEMWEL